MKQRSQFAEERGVRWMKETAVERQIPLPKKTAVKLQEMRSYLRRAEKAELQKKYDEAEKFYIQALTTIPDAHEVKAKLARLYVQTGKEQKAIALYDEVLCEKDDVSYYANIGLAYFRVQEYDRACRSYEQALERDKNNPDRFAALGRAYAAAEKYEEAVVVLEKACARRTRDTDLLHSLAECYMQIQDLQNARIMYSKINKIEPYNEEVKKRLGELATA